VQNLLAPQQQSWFKADLQFGCPSCNKVSTETILVRARDLNAVSVAIVARVTPTCQLCKAVCQVRVPFELVIKDLTPEELANLQIASDTSSQTVM
jgi:transcription elongation factor Elf1